MLILKYKSLLSRGAGPRVVFQVDDIHIAKDIIIVKCRKKSPHDKIYEPETLELSVTKGASVWMMRHTYQQVGYQAAFIGEATDVDIPRFLQAYGPGEGRNALSPTGQTSPAELVDGRFSERFLDKRGGEPDEGQRQSLLDTVFSSGHGDKTEQGGRVRGGTAKC